MIVCATALPTRRCMRLCDPRARDRAEQTQRPHALTPMAQCCRPLRCGCLCRMLLPAVCVVLIDSVMSDDRTHFGGVGSGTAAAADRQRRDTALDRRAQRTDTTQQQQHTHTHPTRDISTTVAHTQRTQHSPFTRCASSVSAFHQQQQQQRSPGQSRCQLHRSNPASAAPAPPLLLPRCRMILAWAASCST